VIALSSALAEYGLGAMVFATFGFFLGGFVKGAVGFALPMVGIACAATVLPKEAAVAYLAIPVFVTNVWQSLRFGWSAAWQTLRSLRLMISVMLVALLAATQVLPALEERVFAAILGFVALTYAVLQLLGWQPKVGRPFADVLFGLLAGIFGGLSGVWGPPTLMLLMTLNLPKQEFVRACGVVFTLGSLPYLLGHWYSGVLNAATAPVSLALVLPTVMGMWLGQLVQDRLDGDVFKRWILIVLLLAGANFLRRALTG
jgi:uncharacterized membrane protein YfcA